jgi:TolB protein
MRCGLAIGVVLLLSACGSGEDSRPPEAATGEELIVFTRGGDSRSALYVMRPDGTGVKQLTRNRALSSSPTWSPDGTRIAFASTPNYDGEFPTPFDLYVVDADGTDTRRLTDNRIDELHVHWMSDGRLAFASCWNIDELRTCRFETLRPDGTERTRLLGAPPEAARIYGTALSPDGSKLAFASPRAGERWRWPDDRFFWWSRNLDIYVDTPDGSGKRRLTDDPGNDGWPVWSPDGSTILFQSDRDRNGDCVFHECAGYASELYVMDADGSDQRRLTHTRADESSPAWSPDGTRIVFARTRDDDRDDFELYVMNADGTCEKRLTDNDTEDQEPSWTGSGGGPLEC